MLAVAMKTRETKSFIWARVRGSWSSSKRDAKAEGCSDAGEVAKTTLRECKPWENGGRRRESPGHRRR